MKQFLLLLLLAVASPTLAHHRILSPRFKTLEVILNDDFEALPVMALGSDDVLSIGLDELSHTYHRLVYHLEACNPDWSVSDGLFESEWLEGFNDRPIDDYENSLNTTVSYTHYRFQIPNADTRIKMSGNYRLHILDEDCDGEEAACVEFRVLEPLCNVRLSVSSNTDIDFNTSHQQVTMQMDYGRLRVTNVQEQVQTIVMQNGREDNMKVNVRPNSVSQRGLAWEHRRELIFDAGNEYHKYEVLDPSHTTMGLAHVAWDEQERRFHAVPFPLEPCRNYVYDEDANGAFLIRNSDNREISTTSDYLYVHYILKTPNQYEGARVMVEGRWATETPETYVMDYDADEHTYSAVVLQKMGYYNYRLTMRDLDGTTHTLPEEGSFYQTENHYQALVYYRGTGERHWRLVGFCDAVFR